MPTTIWVKQGGGGTHSGDSLANAKTLAEAIDYLNVQPPLTDELIFNIVALFGSPIVLLSGLNAMVVNGTAMGRVWWRGVDSAGVDAEAFVVASTVANLFLWSSAGQAQNHVWTNITVTSGVNAVPADNAIWLFRNGIKNCLWSACAAVAGPVGWNLGYNSDVQVSGTLVRCQSNSMLLATIACSNVCEVSAVECEADSSTIGFLNVFFCDRCFAFGCATSFSGIRVVSSCTSDTGSIVAYKATTTAMQFVLSSIAAQTPIAVLGNTGAVERVPITMRLLGEHLATLRISQPNSGYLADERALLATTSPFQDLPNFDYDLNNIPGSGDVMYGPGVLIGDSSVSYHDAGISQHMCQPGSSEFVFTGTVLNRGVN